MQYVISFLEGIITFISPCLLPMLPVYVSYFAGGGERTTRKTLGGAAGFVLGFTLVFVAMGAMAGTLGSFLTKYQTIVNIVSGLLVVFFGLNFMGLLKVNLFKGGMGLTKMGGGFFSAVLFGIIFSLGWTPGCALPAERGAYRQAEVCLQLDQGPLRCDQSDLRRIAGVRGCADDDRYHGCAGGLAELRWRL